MHFHLLTLRLCNSEIWKREPQSVDQHLPNQLTLTVRADSSAALLACSDSLPISEL